MKGRWLLFSILFVAIHVSCSSSRSTRIHVDKQLLKAHDKLSRIKVGMTESEVIHLIGSPFSTQRGFFLHNNLEENTPCPDISPPCYGERAVRESTYLVLVPSPKEDAWVLQRTIYYDKDSTVCCIEAWANRVPLGVPEEQGGL